MTEQVLSVLVTAYNREAYLAETLKSILASSFADFELIVVDDASSDGSIAVAQTFSAVDSRVRIEGNDNNLGDYCNRRKAASLASGKYIKYVDSDDIIYRHSLGVMVDAMEANPEAALGLSHSMPEEKEPYPWFLSPQESFKKHFLERGCLGCGPSGAIIRRAQFVECGGFDPHWGVLSDTELWLRMAARWGVVLMPPGLVWWRRHSGQEFTVGDARLTYLKRGHELDMHVLNQPHCPLQEVDRLAAIAKRRQHFARRLISLALVQAQPRKAMSAFQESDLSFLELAKGVLPYHCDNHWRRKRVEC